MSKIDDLPLPEIANHRWRVVIDIAIKQPKLLLERKVWWGWRRVDSKFISYNVWGNMDTAIIHAADYLLQDKAGKAIAKDYM